MKRNEKTKRLVESSLMIALGTVLSILPIVEMPYGGSVTVASMLPCLLIAYRHGTLWGLGTSLVYAVLQQLLGLKHLSYFTTWQSVVAIILLDYLVAFVVIGLGGIFRRPIKRQNLSLAAGALLASVLRYICHVISGATVWAGLSIPTEAALIGSFAYNATYMVPETLILLLVLFYLSEAMDLSSRAPRRIARAHTRTTAAFAAVLCGGVLLLGACVYSVIAIFSALQISGTLSVSGLAAVPWLWVGLAVLIGLAAFGASVLIASRLDKGREKTVPEKK